MKKLAISAPKDEEIWDYHTSFVCLACSSASQEITAQEPKLEEMKMGIMTALSSAQQSEIKAWEEEILPCEHTLTLQQEPVVVPGNGKSPFFFKKQPHVELRTLKIIFQQSHHNVRPATSLPTCGYVSPAVLPTVDDNSLAVLVVTAMH